MIQHTDAGIRLVLDGALTLRTADAVRAALLQAIEAPPAGSIAGVLIDCAAATEIDLTFIQLLIASRVSVDRMNIALTLAAAPDGALLDTLTRGGFQPTDAGQVTNFWFDRANA